MNEASESPLPNTAITVREVQYSKPTDVHTEEVRENHQTIKSHVTYYAVHKRWAKLFWAKQWFYYLLWDLYGPFYKM